MTRRPPAPIPPREEEIQIGLGPVTLDGTLVAPSGFTGVVVFAHGSGSGRLSPRNRRVAAGLQQAGFATLLFDLLTRDEEQEDATGGHLRFDIEFLAGRLRHVTRWVRANPWFRGRSIGYFGASTGAAAALMAAAVEPDDVQAVVSRGGRPDLAGRYLAEVEAATLLIVGGDDTPVIPLNEDALAQLRAVKRLEIVPGATHLFEEAGALEKVTTLAAEWFERYLGPVGTPHGLG